MPRVIRSYVRIVDKLSNYVGYAAMSLVFVMIAVLLLDAVMRNVIRVPLHWCVEFAQFTLTAYYFMGGAMTLKNDEHVRLDLLYSRLSDNGKAWIDISTIGCLIFYLVIMLIGSISSLQYAIHTNEKRFSIWNPSMIPIKVLLVACLVLMILQSFSLLFKHIATVRGVDLNES
jgi:TRAP-type mannitol/chloroaromatic compound transport system permease small subunit